MRPSRSTVALAAALALLLVKFTLDRLTGESTALVGLYAIPPLLAALATSTGATAVVAALAIVLGLVSTLWSGETDAQAVIRLSTVVVVALMAVWAAWLRERTQRAARRERLVLTQAQTAERELADAFGLLAVIFDHAPIGLAFVDRELRFKRINRRLAEINGVSEEGHAGRTIPEVLPGIPDDAIADIRGVGDTGEPVIEADVAGETPARPGARREWLTSYWPVRRGGVAEVIGIGIVVIEVTERRAAERALRNQTDRYETLLLALSEVGEGMVVLERGRCVYANHAFERLSGYVFPELAAMESIFDLVIAEQREAAMQRARSRVAEGSADPEYQLTMIARDERRVELELAGVPLKLGDRDQLVVVVRDVTARRAGERERERLLKAELAARAETEWARRQAAFLADASEQLDQSLDETRTAQRVAELAVRDFADNSVVLIGASAATIGQVASAAREPERLAIWREVLERYPPQARQGHPLAEVLASGRSRVVRQSLELLERAGLPADHFALLRDMGIRASILVPLRARGRTLGVMGVGFEALLPGAEADLLALFEDLGRRAALAIDNARLYAERAAAARTLQRSLLPPELPQVPGLELAAEYLAAGEGDDVGGDFYDCFGTGDGQWALVIGDVCGKGAEAATVTALARYTLRAAALHSRRPADVLAELNEAILRQGLEYRFCTALYVALTPREGGVEIAVASGGHPLPLLVRADGRVETVGRPGTLLGIVPEPRIETIEAELGPDDALVLYTDGVIEADPVDDALGPDRLAALIGPWAGRPAAGLAQRIADAALDVQGGSLRDDVAVVVARARPAATPFVPLGAGVADAQ